MAKSKFGLFYGANTEPSQSVEGDYMTHWQNAGFVGVYIDMGAGDRNKDTLVGVFNAQTAGCVVRKIS
jgi:hypothetical protein